MVKRAVYAGSFDPVTNGHMWVIEYGLSLFDELIVAIGDNPDKKYTFSVDERLAMLKESIAIIKEKERIERLTMPKESMEFSHQLARLTMPKESMEFSKVQVEYFKNKFLIDYAESQKAQFILRGIRNEQDYAFEKSMAFINQDFGKIGVRTVWAPCPKPLTELSSSFIKGICGPEYWQSRVQNMVPKPVFRRLLAWKGCPDWSGVA
jgi:pantetheine-phosphate adenylyltransferase